MVRHLNGGLLPWRFRAFPQIHLGPFVETDVATLEQLSRQDPAAGQAAESDGGTAAWSPSEAVQTLEVEFPAPDVFEVRVHDEQHGRRLAAVVELVTGNKDRSEQRHALAAKCAAYLQEQVGVVLLDGVTTRRANLHRELLEMLAVPCEEVRFSDLYCVAYRNRRRGLRWRLEARPFELMVGAPLPTVPLWLTDVLAVPLDLEKSYEETRQVLRID